MRWTLGGVALAAAMMAASPVAAQSMPQVAQFSAGSMPFEVSLPEGYCVVPSANLPSGKPDLQLHKCGEEAPTSDFFMVKLTPNIDGGTGATTRAALFASLKSMFDSPDAEALFGAISDKAMRDNNLDMEGGWKPMGMDDLCAYMGAQVSLGDAKLVQGICMTVIGGRTFAIYSTGHGSTVQDLARQIQAVRKLAQSIRPVAPK